MRTGLINPKNLPKILFQKQIDVMGEHNWKRTFVFIPILGVKWKSAETEK